jgi:hypothetical protein
MDVPELSAHHWTSGVKLGNVALSPLHVVAEARVATALIVIAASAESRTRFIAHLRT